MKNIAVTYMFLTILVLSNFANAELAQGKWNLIKETDYCFIGSLPVKIDMPEGKHRGDVYILVYKMNNSSDAIVQIDAGYPYNEKIPVEVKIDNAFFEFYSEEDTAFTKDDKAVIYAMKKGFNLIVNGESSRGTKTSDSYTLKGFTFAFNKLKSDC